MKRILLIILTGLLVGTTGAQAAVVSRIAAVVNDEIITTHQLDLALKKELSRMPESPTPAQLGTLRQDLLSRLIEERLINQRIKALDLKVSKEELEVALQDVQTQNQLSRDDLKEAIKAKGLAFEEYQDNLRNQILRYKLLGMEVRRKIEVSQGEIRDYYRAHLEDYRLPAKVSLSALAFPVPARAGLAEKESIHKAAQTALDLMKNGTSMEEVADQFSTDFGVSFHSLGSVENTALEPAFAAAIENVAAGEFSALIEKETALLLLRVDDRQEAGLQQFPTVEEDIRQHLLEQKSEVRSKEWIKGLKQKAFIDIRI